jgi:K+-transporting ATPase KdpF subunit
VHGDLLGVHLPAEAMQRPIWRRYAQTGRRAWRRHACRGHSGGPQSEDLAMDLLLLCVVIGLALYLLTAILWPEKF